MERSAEKLRGAIEPKPPYDNDVNSPGKCGWINILVILVRGTDRIDGAP
jgi:hypothetical protein